MTPPILTADDAVEIHDEFPWPQIKAIATGRTVVVPVMTEAQAREAFEKRFGDRPRVEMYARDWQSELVGWLAALRHAGVLKP